MSDLRDDSRARRLRAGDASVLMDMLRALAPALRRHLHARYGSRLQDCEIDDALNTALMQLWEFRTSFDAKKGMVATWYRRIVLNAARDILKAKSRHRTLERLVEPVRLDEFANARDSEHGTDQRALSSRKRELLRELESILLDLPEAQRCILLADAESPEGRVDSRELAKKLRLSESTVRVYRQRALRHVRQRVAMRERERERETKLVFGWTV